MALCYNFTRVLNILGFDGFTAYLARVAERLILLARSAAATLRRASALAAGLWAAITEKSAIVRLRCGRAASKAFLAQPLRLIRATAASTVPVSRGHGAFRAFAHLHAGRAP